MFITAAKKMVHAADYGIIHNKASASKVSFDAHVYSICLDSIGMTNLRRIEDEITSSGLFTKQRHSKSSRIIPLECQVLWCHSRRKFQREVLVSGQVKHTSSLRLSSVSDLELLSLNGSTGYATQVEICLQKTMKYEIAIGYKFMF